MELFAQSAALIRKAQNISLFPSKNSDRDILENTSKLYYTLKKLNKNVNFIQNREEDLSSNNQKEFVLYIKTRNKKLEEMYYKKDEENLEIHLGLSEGEIEENDISLREKSSLFGKIDLIITVGQAEIGSNDKNFAFFSEKPIINIDNQNNNKIFGKINLVFPNLSLGEIIDKLIEEIEKKNRLDINIPLFRKILEKLTFIPHKKIHLVTLKRNDFSETKSTIKDIGPILKDIKEDPKLNFPNLLFLFEGHHSQPIIQGLFFGQNEDIALKLSKEFKGQKKGNIFLFKAKNSSLEAVRNKILKTI